MVSRRSATSIAIVAGACFGGLLAVALPGSALPQHQTPPTAEQPPPAEHATVAPVEPSHVEATSPVQAPTGSAPAPEPAAAPAPQGAPPVAGGGTVTLATLFPPPTNATENQRVAVRCGLGSGAACMALAARAQLDGKTEDFRHFEGMSRGMFVKQCHQGDPPSCLALARLYDAGLMAAPRPDSAGKLRERTEMLCRRKPAACADLDVTK